MLPTSFRRHRGISTPIGVSQAAPAALAQHRICRRHQRATRHSAVDGDDSNFGIGRETRPEIVKSDVDRITFGRRRGRRWSVAGALVFLATCNPAEPIPVTNVPEDRDPAWSPDGQSIAFEHAGGDSTPGLYIAHIDGSGRRLLVAGGHGPDWSPDGTALVLGIGFTYQIYRINLASDSVLALTTSGFNVRAAWAPDGESIAFLSDGVQGGGASGLWLMNSDGTGLRRLPLNSDSVGSSGAGDPAWAPTGDRLATAGTFFTSRSHFVNRLFVGDTAGRSRSWLTPSEVEALEPAWSPTGEWIAYVKAPPGEAGDIWLIRPDGTDDHLLARDGFHPTWSPDGQRIAFSQRSSDEVAVWSVDVSGANPQQISWPRGRPPAPSASANSSSPTSGGTL